MGKSISATGFEPKPDERKERKKERKKGKDCKLRTRRGHPPSYDNWGRLFIKQDSNPCLNVKRKKRNVN